MGAPVNYSDIPQGFSVSPPPSYGDIPQGFAVAPAKTPQGQNSVSDFFSNYVLTPARRALADVAGAAGSASQAIGQGGPGPINRLFQAATLGPAAALGVGPLAPQAAKLRLPTVPDMSNIVGRGTDAPNWYGRIAQRGSEAGLAAMGMGGVNPWNGILGGAGGASQQGAAELGAPPWIQTSVGIGVPLAIGAASALLSPRLRAGQIMADASTNPNAPIKPPPIEGMPETTAQATGDPGLLAFQRILEQRPETAPRFAGIRSDQNQAIANELSGSGSWPENQPGAVTEQMQNASAGMGQNISDAYDAALQNERSSWSAAGDVLKTPVPTAPIRANLKTYLTELGPEREDLLPSYLDKIINDKWGDEVTLNGVKTLRSRVLNDSRAAFRAGDSNLKDVLDNVAGILEGPMNSVSGSTAEEQAALDAARQASRDLHGQFGDALTKRIVKTDNAGNPLVAATTIAPKYLNGTPEGLDAYLKATNGSPEAIQSAKDYLIAGLKQRSATSAFDTEGAPYLSPANFAKYYEKNQALFTDDRLFTPDEQEILTRAKAGLDFMNQAAKAGPQGGSDTYAKLARGEYLDAFLGKRATSFLKLIGGGLGYLKGGATGGIIGYGVGGSIGKAMTWAGNNVLKTVNQAMEDPQVAAQLRAFMANPNIPTFTPAVRGALGVTTTNLTNDQSR